MHFTYNKEPAEASVLSQGDVLRRTPELEQVLRKYYPYFGEKEENQFFLIITQACDLVPRQDGICKAKYIELAAIRPVEVVLDRELATHAEDAVNLPFLVAGNKKRPKFEQFVERLYNNNEPEYFFLRQQPEAGLPVDSCAFLHLTVPIKAEHYRTCLQARILSLTNLFQAKLGWLVGHLYARVGTDDWDRGELGRIVGEACKRAGMWVDEKLLKDAAASIRQWQEANPSVQLDKNQLRKILSTVPSKKSQVVGRVRKLITESHLVQRLTGSGSITESDLDLLLKHINQDPGFTALLK